MGFCGKACHKTHRLDLNRHMSIWGNWLGGVLTNLLEFHLLTPDSFFFHMSHPHSFQSKTTDYIIQDTLHWETPSLAPIVFGYLNYNILWLKNIYHSKKSQSHCRKISETKIMEEERWGKETNSGHGKSCW